MEEIIIKLLIDIFLCEQLYNTKSYNLEEDRYILKLNIKTNREEKDIINNCGMWESLLPAGEGFSYETRFKPSNRRRIRHINFHTIQFLIKEHLGFEYTVNKLRDTYEFMIRQERLRKYRKHSKAL